MGDPGKIPVAEETLRVVLCRTYICDVAVDLLSIYSNSSRYILVA